MTAFELYICSILGMKRLISNFHIPHLKLYIKESTNLQRRPRISPSINVDNLEVAKVIGHRFRFNASLQFLCQWKQYSIEDSTYHNATDFIESAARLLVAKYIRVIQNLSRNLEVWAMQHPWALDTIGRFAAATSISSTSRAIITSLVNHLHPPRISSRRSLPSRHSRRFIPVSSECLPCDSDFHIVDMRLEGMRDVTIVKDFENLEVEDFSERGGCKDYYNSDCMNAPLSAVASTIDGLFLCFFQLYSQY